MGVQQRGVVIRTYGDRTITDAIMDGMERGMQPLNRSELAVVKAENEKMREARDGVRQYGDDKRWPETRRALAQQYHVRPCGRVRGALLLAWALVWMEIFDWYMYLQRMNRSA